MTATRMWALDAPTLTFDHALIHAGAPNELITVPCPSFLIEHDRGLVLFDTGPDPDAAGDPAKVYGELHDVMPLDFEVEQRLDVQLEKLGFAVTDVETVVVSHAHFDHIGGAKMFPHARVFIGAGELPWAFWPSPFQRGAFFRRDIDAIPLQNWREISEDLDLFGDGSLVILYTPGHTPGELSMMVKLPSQTFILTGDTAHDHAQLNDLRPLPGDANGPQAVASLRKLQLLAESVPATIWIGHDSDDWERYPHAPESLS